MGGVQSEELHSVIFLRSAEGPKTATLQMGHPILSEIYLYYRKSILVLLRPGFLQFHEKALGISKLSVLCDKKFLKSVLSPTNCCPGFLVALPSLTD